MIRLLPPPSDYTIRQRQHLTLRRGDGCFVGYTFRFFAYKAIDCGLLDGILKLGVSAENRTQARQ